jgi:hypothetical protein
MLSYFSGTRTSGGVFLGDGNAGQAAKLPVCGPKPTVDIVLF